MLAALATGSASRAARCSAAEWNTGLGGVSSSGESDHSTSSAWSRSACV